MINIYFQSTNVKYCSSFIIIMNIFHPKPHLMCTIFISVPLIISLIFVHSCILSSLAIVSLFFTYTIHTDKTAFFPVSVAKLKKFLFVSFCAVLSNASPWEKFFYRSWITKSRIASHVFFHRFIVPRWFYLFFVMCVHLFTRHPTPTVHNYTHRDQTPSSSENKC